MKPNSRALALLTAGLALVTTLAPSASAMLIATPLSLDASPDPATVSDTVAFTIDATNASNAAQYAGRTVHVNVTFQGRDGQTLPPDSTIAGPFALDAKAHGTFTWTVPAAANDSAALVSVLAGNVTLALLRLPIGDAPPMMYAGGVQSHGTGGGSTSDPTPSSTPPTATANTPAMGVLVVAAVLGSVAVTLGSLDRKR